MDYPLTSQPVDDDGLWDELNHQQSREIRQHQSARSRQALQAAISRTALGLKSAAASLKSAYDNYLPVSTSAQQTLDDFGIPNEDPLLHEEPPAQNPDFVLLRPFRLLPKRDGYGAVANLDLFFTSLYNYYYHRGLAPIIGKGVVELASLVVTLWLSVFLFAYVDWRGLSGCTDESTCRDSLSDYLVEKPFRRVSLWNFLVILYCFLFCCYTAFSCWTLLLTVRDALESKVFYEEQLGISSQKLEGGAIDWDRDIVDTILQLQSSGEYRIAIHGQDLDALIVSQRILRKENFMVAFFNRRMLDLSVPGLKGVYFCKSLEWSLYFCILNYMFNHKYQIRPAFYLDQSSLKRRLMLCGVAHAAFMPFLLFFMTLHFFMQNLYDMKSSKKYLGPRDWTLPAKWTFREFNELPHFYERRMGPSYEATEKYLKLFAQSTIVTTVGRLMVLIGGSFGAILVAFAALNDAILLHVKIGDWNLLWYVGVLGVVYSAGKALQPSPDIHPRYIRNLFGEMDAALGEVATFTHYYPEVWKARAWDNETNKAVSALFQYKAKLFAIEVVSVVLAPIILCVSLRKCAEHICEFVMAVKAEIPGAGDVCGYSTFNFDVFGDDNWEGRTMGNGDEFGAQSDLTGSISASVIRTNNVDTATKMHPKPKATQGKMEKSFFSFKANHPSWRSTNSGQTLLDRLEIYKEEETAALARERQHHIAAAARQLETLTRLEQRGQHDAPTRNGRVAGGADSGGGFVQHRIDHSNAPQPQTAESSLPSSQGAHSVGLAPPQHTANRAANQSLGVPHFADVGLSTELTNMLGRSSLDSGLSTLGSVANTTYDPSILAAGHPLSLSLNQLDEGNLIAERQYQLLERYHARLAGRQRMAQSVVGSSTRARPSEALPSTPEEGRFDGRHSAM